MSPQEEKETRLRFGERAISIFEKILFHGKAEDRDKLLAQIKKHVEKSIPGEKFDRFIEDVSRETDGKTDKIVGCDLAEYGIQYK